MRPMSLAAGTRFGSYEIINLIGVGGMGEVYRARDSKLKRDVAIKILPETLAAEADRISRFEREAELLASLNHTNIAVVHDFQQAGRRHFLVMEFVEGETLADRIRRGPLPLDESLQLARQVAEALEAAHQKGIIHRDLKPANIKISNDGKVKVLDFGLAKIFDNSAAPVEASNSPTLMTGTAGGVILGTAAYMSPEQARGKTVDKRTDVWALGCVMYEMLTASQAFSGDSISDTIAGVIRGEPDWSALPSGTSRSVRKLLQRCLQKDPRRRLHDAADVRIEIDDVNAAADPEIAVAAPASSAVGKLLPVGIALLAGLAIASAFWWIRARSLSESKTPMHLSVPLAPDAVSVVVCCNIGFAISPDGQWMTYTVNRAGKKQLIVRSIRESEGKLIDGTDDAASPFFSPDGRWIAFASGKELKKVPVSGGSPVTICNLSSIGFIGGAWGEDDKIVFIPYFNAGIWTVPSNGGTPQLVLNTDESKDRIAYVWPQLLPQSKGILFGIAANQTIKGDDVKIAVLESGAKEPRVLIQGGQAARYTPTGQLIYSRGGELLSVPFDLSRLAVTGTPTPLIQGVEKDEIGWSIFDVSNNGTLLYEPHGDFKPGRRLAMFDRKGSARPIGENPANFNEFSLSPKGDRVAARVFAVNDDIWVYDTAHGTPLRLTFEPRDEIYPQWTSDGNRIAFGTRTGKIFWKSADGTGQREEISSGEYTRYPSSFSPDGKTLAFVEVHPTKRGDIWLMSLDGSRKAQPFLNTDANEWWPKFSPDGHWIAYVSDETGRDEIYLRPIGAPGGRKQVSTEGGMWPAWNRNGRELFFLKGNNLVSVALDAQGNALGKDRVILDSPKFEGVQFDTINNPSYDVMPDGEHFVLALSPRYPSPTHYNVILNLFEELKR